MHAFVLPNCTVMQMVERISSLLDTAFDRSDFDLYTSVLIPKRTLVQADQHYAEVTVEQCSLYDVELKDDDDNIYEGSEWITEADSSITAQIYALGSSVRVATGTVCRWGTAIHLFGDLADLDCWDDLQRIELAKASRLIYCQRHAAIHELCLGPVESLRYYPYHARYELLLGAGQVLTRIRSCIEDKFGLGCSLHKDEHRLSTNGSGLWTLTNNRLMLLEIDTHGDLWSSRAVPRLRVDVASLDRDGESEPTSVDLYGDPNSLGSEARAIFKELNGWCVWRDQLCIWPPQTQDLSAGVEPKPALRGAQDANATLDVALNQALMNGRFDARSLDMVAIREEITRLVSDSKRMADIFEDYAPLTAESIVNNIPKAWQEYNRHGGRWGHAVVAEVQGVQVSPETVSRYLVAMYKSGLRFFYDDAGEPIPNPSKPRISRPASNSL